VASLAASQQPERQSTARQLLVVISLLGRRAERQSRLPLTEEAAASDYVSPPQPAESRSRPLGQGHATPVIRSLIALGHLGRSMEREALAVDQLTTAVVSTFVDATKAKALG